MRKNRPMFHTFHILVIATVLSVAAVSVAAVSELNTSPLPETPAEAVSFGSVETALAAGSAKPQKQYRYVRCESTSKRRNTCETFGKNPVRLWQRHSSAKCRKKKDWNSYDGGRFIWVANGCRATFQVRER